MFLIGKVMSLVPQCNTLLSLIEQHRGSGYEQTLVLCTQREFTQHHKTKIQLCSSKPARQLGSDVASWGFGVFFLLLLSFFFNFEIHVFKIPSC